MAILTAATRLVAADDRVRCCVRHDCARSGHAETAAAIPAELAALGVAHIEEPTLAVFGDTRDGGRGDCRAPRAVLLCLPAMGAQAGYYRPFAHRLAASLDATVVLADLRGQGVWREPQPGARPGARPGADGAPRRARRFARSFGYADIVERDMPQLVRRLAARYAGRPLFIVGHSLGGQFGVLATAHVAARIAGVVLLAAGTAHHRAWPAAQRWRAALAVHAIRAVSALLPAYPGSWLGFGGDQPRRLMRDWGRNATTGTYRLTGSGVDYAAALAAVRLPVLAVEVAGDAVAPPGAIAELVSKLPRADVERATVRGVAGHSPWRRHFSWARRPDDIVAAIAPWIRARCIRSGRRDVSAAPAN
jgi:predicted alpha/beta hydrolase